MDFTTVTMKKAYLIGMTIKTEQSKAGQDIPDLFQDFDDLGGIDVITNQVNGKLICAYFDYEGDHTQPYTYFIGCMTTSNTRIPAGMICKEIPEGKYAKIQVTGQYPQSLLDTWEKINASDIKRAYNFDFEQYGQFFTEDDDFQFSIYLSLEQ